MGGWQQRPAQQLHVTAPCPGSAEAGAGSWPSRARRGDGRPAGPAACTRVPRHQGSDLSASSLGGKPQGVAHELLSDTRESTLPPDQLDREGPCLLPQEEGGGAASTQQGALALARGACRRAGVARGRGQGRGEAPAGPCEPLLCPGGMCRDSRDQLSHCPRRPLAAGPRPAARRTPTQEGLRGEPRLWPPRSYPAPHVPGSAPPATLTCLRRELPVRDSAVPASDLALAGLLSVCQEGKACGDGGAGPPGRPARTSPSARQQPAVKAAQNSSKIAPRNFP